MSVSALRDLVSGPVIDDEDPDYEDARHVYNFMIEARPYAIVQCASAKDVQAVVEHAAVTGRPVAIRGGGHSVPGFGTADDAIVADLSPMTRIEVDPGTRTATVSGGATLGMMNDATTAYGLATTGGIVASTGADGLTLGGGIGYLTRKHGLSCDNLVSAEIVLAD
jgi:FAD/FMN-containing dehydrogenase